MASAANHSLLRAHAVRLSGKYVPTQGVSLHSLSLTTNVVATLWDTAGVERHSCLRDAYYINSDIAIIFAESAAEVFFWAKEVARVVPNSTLYAYVPKVLSPQLSAISKGPVSFIYREDVNPKTFLESILVV